MMLSEIIGNVKRIGISGHIHPDGDCIGACLGLRSYIYDNFESVTVDVFLEPLPPEVMFLKGSESILSPDSETEVYDVFFALDCGSLDRLGESVKHFERAKKKIVFDHHRTNAGFGDYNDIRPEISSTCELLMDYMEEKLINIETAECLYLGLVHDTGVFKYSCTGRRTMELAGTLIEKGVVPAHIIDRTFYEKTFTQNKLLGECLLNMTHECGDKAVFSYADIKLQKRYGATASDFEGVVEQLRNTKGVEVAVFIKEESTDCWKVSFRACDYADVATIAEMFGGGGHTKAAGCTLSGSCESVKKSVLEELSKQLH